MTKLNKNKTDLNLVLKNMCSSRWLSKVDFGVLQSLTERGSLKKHIISYAKVNTKNNPCKSTKTRQDTAPSQPNCKHRVSCNKHVTPKQEKTSSLRNSLRKFR